MGNKREYNDDDGRIIADMNVDGMPWTDGTRFPGFSIIPKFNKRQRYKSEDMPPQKDENIKTNESDLDEITPKEFRGSMIRAVLAALTIFLIFSAVFVLFILFCINVWFK